METRIVTIDLPAGSYDIFIGSGLASRAGELTPQDLAGRSAFIIADANVRTVADGVAASLRQGGAARVEAYFLKGGEAAKSFAQVEILCDWMLAQGVSRGSILYAVGGGVIGDLAGFCASIIMRGIRFVQVPTTLLAQVDSSVGGKTGINTPRGKNLIGSFYQPSAVLIDMDALASLPERELLAGYAEIVKYGLIQDSAFFSWLERDGRKVLDREPAALARAIETSVRMKARIVQADEREETGQRALLNLGHTFGHALEASAGYDGRLLHGEAVAIGICMAFDLSARMGLCAAGDVERVERHFADMGLPTRASYISPALSATAEELLAIMRLDKKASGGKMRFIVAGDIGHAYALDDVDEGLVLQVLKDSLGAPARSMKDKWKSAFTT